MLAKVTSKTQLIPLVMFFASIFFFEMQCMLFDNFLKLKFSVTNTNSCSLVHACDCPLQKVGSFDYSIYVMRFMEQILQGEKLHLLVSDKPFLRLEYATRILEDGIVYSLVVKEDTAHVEVENPVANDIVEVAVANKSAAHVPEDDPADNMVSKLATENMAIDPLVLPTIGSIETSTY